MARRKAKFAWGKICFWLATAVLVGIIVWINVNRFKHNIYANYEKAVDYGRVREEKLEIKPAVAAIFYADKDVSDGRISTYLNHAAEYMRRQVKMAVAPQILTPDTVEVVAKLYDEIKKHNEVKHIILVYQQTAHMQKHSKLLKEIMLPESFDVLQFEAENDETISKIENYLQQKGVLIVILADLSGDIKNNFLVQKAIYWAQKYAYNVNVFDIIDTKIAEAVDKNYAALLTLSNGGAEEPRQMQQKHNLEQYVRRYGHLLKYWFELNIERTKENLPPMWPLKSDETYRLYDRGTLYAESGQLEKLVNNEGIVVALVRMAQRFAHKNADADTAHLYLLTENEEFIPLRDDLDADDGVYLQYKSHKAVVLPKKKPQKWKDLEALLRLKAKISGDADETKFRYYKFKAVEIDNEN